MGEKRMVTEPMVICGSVIQRWLQWRGGGRGGEGGGDKPRRAT